MIGKAMTILSMVLAADGTALAQAPQTAPPQRPHAPVVPPSVSKTPPEKIAPHAIDPPSLSDKLSKERGTIKPPPVDKEMTVKPPQKGTMPVIKPPVTRGNSKVVPK